MSKITNATIDIRRARKAEALAYRLAITEERAAELLARTHWVMDAAIEAFKQQQQQQQQQQ